MRGWLNATCWAICTALLAAQLHRTVLLVAAVVGAVASLATAFINRRAR